MFLRKFLLALTLVLAGCGGKVEKKDSTLRLNLYCEPPTLDPTKMTDATSANVLINLFEGLTRIGENDQPEPALAKKISLSPDGCTYTFHLRKSSWSNGDPLTAFDFERTWKKIVEPLYPAPNAYKHFVIKNGKRVKSGELPADAFGVKARDAHTLVVELENPTPYFLQLTAFPNFFPLHASGNYMEGGNGYISNGPFWLKRWKHESEIVLEKNQTYWDHAAVRLPHIVMTMIPDTLTEYYMFEMGELDWAGAPLSNLPVEILPALQKEGKVSSYPISAVYYFKLNTERPPLHNPKIRRALGLAVNRQAIVDHILQANQHPALALVPPMAYESVGRAFFQDGYQLEAKRLLDEGLAEMGLDLEHFPTLTLICNTNREHQKIAQALQHQWNATLGIQVELQNFDWKMYLAKVNSQDFDIARMGWVGDFNDPLSFLEPFKLNDENNNTGWTNPTYQDLLDLSMKASDPGKREAILLKAEELLIQEMPIIPLYYIIGSYLKKSHVRDVYLSPLGMADFKRAQIKR